MMFFDVVITFSPFITSILSVKSLFLRSSMNGALTRLSLMPRRFQLADSGTQPIAYQANGLILIACKLKLFDRGSGAVELDVMTRHRIRLMFTGHKIEEVALCA